MPPANPIFQKQVNEKQVIYFIWPNNESIILKKERGQYIYAHKSHGWNKLNGRLYGRSLCELCRKELEAICQYVLSIWLLPFL